MRRVAICSVVVSALVLALPGMAQDPTKVDPEHYKVILENDQVRVLRIIYGPHYKGKMHEHPASVVVWLTDIDATITSADGKVEEVHGKAGEVTSREAVKHRGENNSDQPFEVIQVEFKSAAAAGKRIKE